MRRKKSQEENQAIPDSAATPAAIKLRWTVPLTSRPEFADADAEVAWRVHQALKPLLAAGGVLTGPTSRVITFFPETEVAGEWAIIFAGALRSMPGEDAYEVPEQMLYLLDKLQIPYRLLQSTSVG
jgi:hypothetical protein